MPIKARVEHRSGESFDKMLKRFRKEVTRSGALSAARRKRWFISKSEERRYQEKKAIRRARRRKAKRAQRGY